MSHLLKLPVGGLKEGQHKFDFEIGDEFFEGFEESEIRQGSLVAVVEMEKRSTHADLTISIRGSVIVPCDRCLEMFSMPVDCENRLLVKFGKSIEGADPDIVSMSSDEHELELSQHFYDYINLALPIRRIHGAGNAGSGTCDPEMLKRLEELRTEEGEANDPRWDDLKKLMNDN
ncbi:MAG: DUF177 domain-containing protein [Bacteroidales bacterium]|jgi:uncharacterized metal-binding protein YceD (DUF177 family)|nr:DUF177 domain-containing protein [Bacteroidales bacterium]